MDTIMNSLLRTTKFDDEVTSNAGNDHEILPTLIHQYRKVCQYIVPLKEMKYALISNRKSKFMRNLLMKNGMRHFG